MHARLVAITSPNTRQVGSEQASHERVALFLAGACPDANADERLSF